MMSFFSMPKPRRFSHKYIYIDERKEYLEAMEKKARLTTCAEKPDMDDAKKRLHASFLTNMRHVTRRNDYRQHGSLMINVAIVAIIILILVVVWRMLLSI